MKATESVGKSLRLPVWTQKYAVSCDQYVFTVYEALILRFSTVGISRD